MIPLVEHLFNERKLRDEEPVRLTMDVVQINFLAELIFIDIATFILVQVVDKRQSLRLREGDAQNRLNSKQNFVSVH